VSGKAVSAQIAKSDSLSAIFWRGKSQNLNLSLRVFLAYGVILLAVYYSILSDRLLENALKYNGKLVRGFFLRR